MRQTNNQSRGDWNQSANFIEVERDRNGREEDKEGGRGGGRGEKEGIGSLISKW